VPSRLKAKSHGQLISLTETLKTAKGGESFLVDDVRFDASCRAIASKLKISIRTEKIPFLGLRVHRVA